MTCVRRPAGAQSPPPSAGSPRNPERRPGRFRARLFRLLPALALLLGALSPFAAAPASADVLVSNIGENPTSVPLRLINVLYAQKFTTGSNAPGYTLTSIEYEVSTLIRIPGRMVAYVQPVDTDGNPDSSNRVVLNVPGSLPVGIAAFTAPANTTLAANTSYFAIIGSSFGTVGAIYDTASDSEQKATGWSLADNRLQRTVRPTGAWQSSNRSLKLRINGTAISTKTYEIAAATVGEGATAELTVTLGENAPAGGLALDVSYDYSGGTATRSDLASRPLRSRVVVQPGQKTAALNVPTASDVLVEGDETFAVTIAPASGVTGWTVAPGSSATATVTITDDDDDNAKIGFDSADATSVYTATVAENVARGILEVPVTVSYLPGASTTFNIEVLGGGTATENADYRIATKSVTFGSSGSTTRYITVTLIDDAVGEDPETIKLRIAAADSPVNDLGDYYARHEDGATATITVTSEDPPPAPANLRVRPGKERLTLNWAAPAGVTVTGYDVEYTSTSPDVASNDAPALGNDPSAGWVTVDRGAENDPPTASQAIADLDAGTVYRMRVRAVNDLAARGKSPPSELWG